MKKKLSLLLALLLCLGLVPKANASSSPFGDVPTSHWAYSEIIEAYNDGVMTGTAAGVFSPSSKLNMAQFVTVLTRAFYNEDVANSTRSGNWPNQNYDAAEKHNLFAELTRYAREVEVTREVMAQMMYNVMVDKGATLPGQSEVQATITQIPDIFSVDGSFRTAVAVCYYLDLLSGVDAQGTFAPKGVLNRAQTAVIYVRLEKAVTTLSTGVPVTPGTTPPETPQAPSGATLTNGMPVTEENVLALIEEYHNGKEPGEKATAAGFTSYENGGKYDAYEPKYRIVLPDGPLNGIECAKFAFAFFDDIFGADTPTRKVTNLADIRPGDLIHFPGHWAIVTKAPFYKGDDNINLFVESVGGGPSGEIGWQEDGHAASTIINVAGPRLDAAYTRYPE